MGKSLKTTPLMAGFINLAKLRSLAVRKYLTFDRAKMGGKARGQATYTVACYIIFLPAQYLVPVVIDPASIKF